MKIAIVDDDVLETTHLLTSISAYMPPETRIDTFPSGESFLASFKPYSYDLVLLDIYMSGMLGVDAARAIREKDQEVCLVFCTTSNEFASESYDVNARFYLRKPITEEAIQRMFQRLDLAAIKHQHVLTLPGDKRVLLHSIYFTECSGHNITFHQEGGAPLTVRMTQKQLTELLAPYPRFVCCSKGIIVNLERTQGLNDDGFLLPDGRLVPISRRRLKDMKEAYTRLQFALLRQKG